jgi:hypothetical protein
MLITVGSLTVDISLDPTSSPPIVHPRFISLTFLRVVTGLKKFAKYFINVPRIVINLPLVREGVQSPALYSLFSSKVRNSWQTWRFLLMIPKNVNLLLVSNASAEFCLDSLEMAIHSIIMASSTIFLAIFTFI